MMNGNEALERLLLAARNNRGFVLTGAQLAAMIEEALAPPAKPPVSRFPAGRYHATKPTQIVQNEAEEANFSASDGWSDRPVVKYEQGFPKTLKGGPPYVSHPGIATYYHPETGIVKTAYEQSSNRGELTRKELVEQGYQPTQLTVDNKEEEATVIARWMSHYKVWQELTAQPEQP